MSFISKGETPMNENEITLTEEEVKTQKEWEEQQAKIKALLERSEQYHQTKSGYDPYTDQYIYFSPFCPTQQLPVGATLEPLVEAPEWGLGDDHKLTLNHYNALVLNSRTMAVIDIDFDDRRLNKWAVDDIHQVVAYMQDMAALEQRTNTKWSKETWKLYRTIHGARLICISRPLPLDVYRAQGDFRHLCQFLGADPLYTQKCIEQRCYRARLTPKSHDESEVAVWVATLWDYRTQPHPEIAAALSLHDEVAGYCQQVERPTVNADLSAEAALAEAEFLEELKNMGGPEQPTT
jgi:hypothetical protein